MENKTLGTSQVLIPEIGCGTWNYMGGIEPLRHAVARGACFIDTAEAYGTEEIVGEAIQGRRDEVFLATKALPRNFRRTDLISAAEQSLQRLRTHYLDLYQLHWPNYVVPIEETMEAMEQLVEMGKVRFIGVSNFSIAELKKAQASLSKHKIVSNQVRYSLIDRTVEGGLLNYCQETGITLIALSPLGVGLSRMRAHDPGGAMARTAAEYGKTEAQIALNWLIAKRSVVTIPKSSTIDHVSQNCGASGWRLSEESMRFLDREVHCRRRSNAELAFRRLARRALQLTGRQL